MPLARVRCLTQVKHYSDCSGRVAAQAVYLDEIVARAGARLAVAGVVYRLDAHHLFSQGRIMLEQMLDQPELGVRRAHDQYLACIGQGLWL